VNRILGAALVAFAALCAAPPAQAVTVPAAGTIFEGSMPIMDNVRIPLPPGKWRFIGWDTSKDKETDRTKHEVLLFTLDPTNPLWEVEATFYERSTALYGAVAEGFPASKVCGKNLVLYDVTVVNTTGGDQDCWFIDHRMRNYTDPLGDRRMQLVQYLKSQNLTPASTTIGVVHLFANRNTSLVAEYKFDPLLEGIEKDNHTRWSRSNWHRNRAFDDPKKAAFIERLKAFGAAIHPAVKSGFEGKLPAQ
jgi:hypothetical protein